MTEFKQKENLTFEIRQKHYTKLLVEVQSHLKVTKTNIITVIKFPTHI